jgi:putative ABC transport system permease protein
MKYISLSIHLALSALKKNVVRSGLTVFGITVGIAMVIIVLSAGNSVKALVLSEVSSFGDNWIQTEIKVPSAGKTSQENATGIARGVSITTMTIDDMRALMEIDQIQTAYAAITTQVVASYGQEKKRYTVFGVSYTYDDIDAAEVEEGRFFTEQEENSLGQVAVIGSQVRETLFGNADPIDKLIKIDGKGYRVVGVVEPVGSAGFINMDEMVFLPLKTVQKKIMGIDHVLWITSQVQDNDRAEQTAEEMRQVMRQRHGISDPDKDDFAITTMNEALDIINTVFRAITYLLVALAGVSLLVGGVGIMNVMYVSVVERTFEIGLRKSAGATNRHILVQFLIEAIAVTLLGAIAGVLLGAVIIFLAGTVAEQVFGLDWERSISLGGVLLSIVFSVGIGMFFGLHPAKKAAAMDPIVALTEN